MASWSDWLRNQLPNQWEANRARSYMFDSFGRALGAYAGRQAIPMVGKAYRYLKNDLSKWNQMMLVKPVRPERKYNYSKPVYRRKRPVKARAVPANRGTVPGSFGRRF